MPLFLFPVLTVLAYAFVGGNIIFDKHTGAKSFSHLAVMLNLVTLAIIFATQKRMPLGGLFETCAEMALVIGVIYAFFIPMDLKKLSLTMVGVSIILMVVSFFGGLKPFPHLSEYVSWWLQFSMQSHLLAGGLLLFCLICLFNTVLSKDKSHTEEILSFARTGLLTALAVLVLGVLCNMMWNFVVTGEMLLWTKRLLMNFAFVMVLVLPLVFKPAWFKEARNKTMFDIMVIALVFLVNLAEWGGLA